MKVTLNAHISLFYEFYSNSLKFILYVVKNQKKFDTSKSVFSVFCMKFEYFFEKKFIKELCM